MQLKLVEDEGTLVRLSYDGEINYRSADGDPMAEHLGPNGYVRTVLLDLERSTYINSAGISWLLNCHKKFKQGGGKFIIHSIPPLVMEILQVVRLETIMHFVANEEAARALAVRMQS